MGCCCSCCGKKEGEGHTPLRSVGKSSVVDPKQVVMNVNLDGAATRRGKPHVTAKAMSFSSVAQISYADLEKTHHRMATQRDSKIVRVFLSSTFKDMARERQAIVEKTIPRARAELSKRGLQFVPIDLRWGITEEEGENGQTVYLCLKNVVNSRYFIGFLKARYGWHQDPQKPDDVSLQKCIKVAIDAGYPFLEKYRHRSVTEHEILLGAFMDEQGNERLKKDSTRFFFASKQLCEQSINETPEDARESKYAEEMLANLKSSVIQAGMHNAEYTSDTQLSSAMFDALMEMVNRDYPVTAAKTWLEQERQKQQVYREMFLDGYIPLENDFRALDAYALGSYPDILVVEGSGGSGRSALLANWLTFHSERNPNDVVVAYSVGASEHKLQNFLRYAYEELQQRFQIRTKLDFEKKVTLGGNSEGDDSVQNQKFKKWVLSNMPSFKNRVILIADGLDDLKEDTTMLWLSTRASANFRIIVSADSFDFNEESAVYGALKKQELQHRVLTVQGLDASRKEKMINFNLQLSGKNLLPELKQRMIDSDKTSKPRFLSLVLDQLKESQNVTHEVLGDVLDRLLRCKDVSALLTELIFMWTKAHPIGLTKTVLSCIEEESKGLLESELQAIAGVGTKVSMLQWVEFQAATSIILKTTADGLTVFSHWTAGAAVRAVYDLNNEVEERDVHSLLGEFFFNSDVPVARRASVGVTHLRHAKDWQRLCQLLLEPDVIGEIVGSGIVEDMAAISNLREEHAHAWLQMNKEREAVQLYRQSLERFANSKSSPAPSAVHLASCYVAAGSVLKFIGEDLRFHPAYKDRRDQASDAERGGVSLLQTAISLFEQAARGRVDQSFYYKYAFAHFSLGSLHFTLENFDDALDHFRKALKTVQDVGPNSLSAIKYTAKIADTYYKKSQYDEAIRQYNRIIELLLRLHGNIDDHPDIVAFYRERGKAYELNSDYEEAITDYTRVLKFYEASFGDEFESSDTAIILYTLGDVYLDMEKYDVAETYFEKAMAGFRAQQDNDYIARMMEFFIKLYIKRKGRGDSKKKDQMLKEYKALKESMGEEPDEFSDDE